MKAMTIVRRVRLMSVCFAAGLVSAAAATPNLSGIWELHHDSRSVPRAELTAAARRVADARAYADLESLRWCRLAGMPQLMDSPLDIRQGRIEIAIVSPMESVARHLYVDGRRQVQLDDFEVTTNGNSVAHWDGDVLIVETIGFSDRGMVSIPGGGFRTSKSMLQERYRLLADGKRLSVTFTWTDPSTYVKPHSYEFMYFRRAPTTNAAVWACEPHAAERERFFAPALESLKK